MPFFLFLSSLFTGAGAVWVLSDETRSAMRWGVALLTLWAGIVAIFKKEQGRR